MAEKEYISREAAFNAILKLVPKVDDDGYCWVIRGDAAMAGGSWEWTVATAEEGE